MLRIDIRAMTPQPGDSKPAPGHKIYPYLLRNLVMDRPNQVWALDTTYIPMCQGFVHLTAIVNIINTDQGRQFKAESFTAVVLEPRTQLPIGGRGAWRDNVFMKRLRGSGQVAALRAVDLSTASQLRHADISI
jgi:putative transposase